MLSFILLSLLGVQNTYAQDEKRIEIKEAKYFDKNEVEFPGANILTGDLIKFDFNGQILERRIKGIDAGIRVAEGKPYVGVIIESPDEQEIDNLRNWNPNLTIGKIYSKNETDRHWAGGGKIMIDRKVVDLYLSQVDFDKLEKTRFELVDIEPTDKQNFAELENEKMN